MWRRLPEGQFGLMNGVDDVVARAAQRDPSLLPDLRSSQTLLAASDYSGQQKGSCFEAYAFLFTTLDHWPHWERRRLRLRATTSVGKRRLGFKSLGDWRKRKALPGFLGAADELPGLCVVVLVERSIGSLFQKSPRLQFNKDELHRYAHYGPIVFERLLRVVHLLSFFVAGLSSPGQNLMWFTDQDDIAANDERVIELTHIVGNIASHYLQHDLGHVRCGTTACDNGTLQIEDLVAVADLAAGAAAELATRYRSQGTMPAGAVIVPEPAKLTRKTKELLGWLCQSGVQLKRLILILEAARGTTEISVKHLQLHNIGLCGR